MAISQQTLQNVEFIELRRVFKEELNDIEKIDKEILDVLKDNNELIKSLVQKLSAQTISKSFSPLSKSKRYNDKSEVQTSGFISDFTAGFSQRTKEYKEFLFGKSASSENIESKQEKLLEENNKDNKKLIELLDPKLIGLQQKDFLVSILQLFKLSNITKKQNEVLQQAKPKKEKLDYEILPPERPNRPQLSRPEPITIEAEPNYAPLPSAQSSAPPMLPGLSGGSPSTPPMLPGPSGGSPSGGSPSPLAKPISSFGAALSGFFKVATKGLVLGIGMPIFLAVKGISSLASSISSLFKTKKQDEILFPNKPKPEPFISKPGDIIDLPTDAVREKPNNPMLKAMLGDGINVKIINPEEISASNQNASGETGPLDVLKSGIDAAAGVAGAAGTAGTAKAASKMSKFLGVAGKAAKVLGPAAALAGAAYSGFEGFQNTEANFDLKEGEQATLGQKVSSTLGGIASGATFGLLNEKAAAQGIQRAGELVSEKASSTWQGIKDFFGGSDTSKVTPVSRSTGMPEQVSNLSITNEELKTSASAPVVAPPIVSNTVQTNNTQTLSPIKAQPRSAMSSALERYVDRVSAFA